MRLSMLVSSISVLATFILIYILVTSTGAQDIATNRISQESGAGASAFSTGSQPLVSPAIPPPLGAPIPPVIGAGAGAGFHKSLDFSVGGGAGAGYGPLLALLGGGLPPPALGGVPPIPAAAPGMPLPLDPTLAGAAPFAYPGYPGFGGPSYVPYSWLGSALGAKGDLLFPIVIFVFVIVGIWFVVQFLLGLIVPLIAGKLAVGKALLGKKFRRETTPDFDPWDAHEDRIDQATDEVLPAIDKNADQYDPMS